MSPTHGVWNAAWSTENPVTPDNKKKDDDKKPMSNGLKIGLIVGGCTVAIAILIVIIVMLHTSKMKKMHTKPLTSDKTPFNMS
jgi:hypothetical protein